MLPAGTRSDAFFTPLNIWSKTGTVGGSKETPLTRKFVRAAFCICVRAGTVIATTELSAYEYYVQVDINVSTAGNRISRLKRMTQLMRVKVVNVVKLTAGEFVSG